MRTYTYAERPDLAVRTGEIEDTLAPFMGYGEVALRHWSKLRPELPELQLILWDEEHDQVVGHAHGGRGLSRLLLEAMRELAGRAGFSSLIAPVRPTWKERYPLIAMDEYARWQRDDGLPFDPWLRVHARIGGELLQTAPESMRIEGTAAEWQEWTGMAFPGDGAYVVPGALVPVQFAGGRGVYVEPNFWVRHRVQ